MKRRALFRERVPLPILWLGVVEFGTLVAAVFLGAYARFMDEGFMSRFVELEDIELITGPMLPKALVYAAVMLAGMVSMGLYSTSHLVLRGPELGIRVLLAHVVGLIGFIVVSYVAPALFLGRGVLLLTFLSSLAGVSLVRAGYLRLTSGKAFQRRILVYGAGARAASIESVAGQLDRHGISILGFYPVGDEQGVRDRSMVVRERVPLADYAKRHGIDELVVAVDDRRSGIPLDDLLDCRMSGIHVVELPSFFEEGEGKVRLDLLTPSWLIFSDGFQYGPVDAVGKWIFDRTASVLLLVVSLPVMLLAALAIKLEDGWRAPVFYRQTRVGQWGTPFEIIKFRSMRVDAERDSKPQWARKDDDRITRVGRFLRKARIDELPQLINVLRGEMSFVGPRPERPAFVRDLAQRIPYYNERHRLKPGITGWAQINYPYGASVRDAMEKLQYDLYYTKHHGVLFDLYILLRTLEVVLFGKGSR